jgi:thiamine biosynthesis protein ThiI
VASWYALKRGAEVYYLFLNLDGEEYLKNVLDVARVLADNWSYGYRPMMYVVPGKDIVIEILTTREDYWNVLLKRILYRLGEMLAKEVRADSLITGESLGQVSSQTLKNLRVSQEAVEIPVNRPLFGMDKEEIIRVAREIGTYDYSAKVWEYCALVPEKPTLNASLKVVLEEEAKMDMGIIQRAYSEKEVIDLRSLGIG